MSKMVQVGVGAKQRKSGTALTYVLLTVGALLTVFPFVWMILTAFKTKQELFFFTFWPENPTWDNFKYLFDKTLFPRWYLNSAIVVVASTISVVFFDALVGYTFATMNFRGKNVLFILILSTMMIPTEMLVIPWYQMSVNYGWVNTYWGLMFPGMITAFGIFLLRQFMEGIPRDLLDAARVDGMNEFAIFWKVALPQVKPALGALVIFNFLGNWNAFLWPLIVADKGDMRTIPVGLSLFADELFTEYHLVMAGATVAVIPVLIVFLIFQRQIIEGVVLTGMK